jgi:hypothetical protein
MARDARKFDPWVLQLLKLHLRYLNAIGAYETLAVFLITSPKLAPVLAKGTIL